MDIKNRNLFRLTRLVLLKLPFILRFLAKNRQAEKRILVIRTDAIGDYILFRNYIEEFRKADKYKDYKIDLLGNKLWSDLAMRYDTPYIDNFIFIDPNKLYEQPSEAWRLGWQLYNMNYELVLQPAYSRILLIDGLAALTAAKEIIAFESDTELIFQKYKKKTDKFYTKRLLLPPAYNFEFERNQFFFQEVTNSTINIRKPTLPVERNNNSNYVIIFPASGVINKNWPIQNFVEISKNIIEHTNFHILLAGAKSEKHYAEPFINQLPANRIFNRIGATSLIEAVELIAGARYVVCNDSSALHIAAACNTPTVCIHGGGHFTRFVPYPESYAANTIFVYEKMACFNCTWKCVYDIEKNETYPCVATNEVARAWEAVLRLMHIKPDLLSSQT